MFNVNELAIVPAPDEEGFVALTSAKSRSRLFEKHILNYGDLYYPGVAGGKVKIDDEFADTLINNFKAKYCPIVQVPLAGPDNEHSEDPTRNAGRVVGLTKRNNKIYAQFEAKKHAEDFGETLLGASAMFHLNYTDTKTMKKVGPTLLHLAVTNRPYVTDLEDYREVVAASADGIGEAVMLTASHDMKEERMLTLDETLDALKKDHGIDVRALQLSVSKSEEAVALSNAIRDELLGSDVISLSAAGDEPTADELIGAVKGAAAEIVALSNKIEEGERAAVLAAAEADVDALVRTGHILPANKAAMVKLSMTDADLFKSLIPETPLVKLSHERGTDYEPSTEEVAQATVTEIANTPEAQRYLNRK